MNTQPPFVTALGSASERDKHTMSVMGSSKDMTWPTPQEWFDYLNLEFGFTLDPCCEHATAKCTKHYTPAEKCLRDEHGEDLHATESNGWLRVWKK